MARLLQTLSSCRTEYFGRLGMVKVSFGSIASLAAAFRHFPFNASSEFGLPDLYRIGNHRSSLGTHSSAAESQ